MTEIKEFVKKYSPQLGQYFAKRIAEIDREIDLKVGALMKEKAELQELIKQLKGSLDSSPQLRIAEILDVPPIYSTKMNLIEKVQLVMNENEYLTLNEIANRIIEKEPNINRNDLKGHLSAILAMDAKRDEPRLIRRNRESEKKWEYMVK